MDSFTDWFLKIALPYFKTVTGKKVIIGDNLSSHLSLAVITECEKHNISFVFLPANSSHLTQPLDVSFFRPMKIAWRKILEQWKRGEGRKKSSVPKETFPALLTKLENEIMKNSVNNLKSGFKKCGIAPLNRTKILDRIPNLQDPTDRAEHDANATVDASIKSLLSEMRFQNTDLPPKKKKKLDVPPGKSVQGCDFSGQSEDAPDNSGSESENEVPLPTTPKRRHLSIPKATEVQSSMLGVTKILKTNIVPGIWVLVNFSPSDGASKVRKRKLVLGRVEKILENGEFVGLFISRHSALWVQHFVSHALKTGPFLATNNLLEV